MTLYASSNWAIVRLFISMGLIFIMGFAFCMLVDEVFGEPVLHGFYYGNGSLYSTNDTNGGCDIDDETYNITGFCDPDEEKYPGEKA